MIKRVEEKIQVIRIESQVWKREREQQSNNNK